MVRTALGFCALAACGHKTAAPPISVMNSRRLIGPTSNAGTPHITTSLRQSAVVQHSKIDRQMAALGPFASGCTPDKFPGMSAAPPIARKFGHCSDSAISLRARSANTNMRLYRLWGLLSATIADIVRGTRLSRYVQRAGNLQLPN
jgi:hypothetical protein